MPMLAGGCNAGGGSQLAVSGIIFAIVAFGTGAIIGRFFMRKRFEKIAGFMIFEDTLVPRMTMITEALSGVGFYFLVQTGYATYSVKPILLTGLMVGGAVFTLIYPYIKPLMGADLGKLQISDFFGEHSLLVTIVFSSVLLATAYFLPSLEYKDSADFKKL